jgi:predicted nucleic acid-binding protein
MKILIDTSIWIEWITDGNLASQVQHYLKKLENIIVPTIVQFELYRWLCRERDIDTAISIIAITEQCMVIPLDTTLALFAGDIAIEHKLAMADAIVYATAVQSGALLITCDKHFSQLKDVKYYSKSS